MLSDYSFLDDYGLIQMMNVEVLIIVETWLNCRNLMLLELLKLDVA